MKVVTTILMGVALAAVSCTNQSIDQTQTDQKDQVNASKYSILDSLDNRVKVEDIPSFNVLTLSYKGNYKNHPEAYGKLMQYAAQNYKTVGAIIGIYPQDPDLHPESELSWSISYRIIPGSPGISADSTQTDPFAVNASLEELNVPLDKFQKPADPFVLVQLPATKALTLVSDVSQIGKDGLAINAWLDLNNFVQVGLTRTEFGTASEKGQPIPVRIIVPVKERTQEKI